MANLQKADLSNAVPLLALSLDADYIAVRPVLRIKDIHDRKCTYVIDENNLDKYIAAIDEMAIPVQNIIQGDQIKLELDHVASLLILAGLPPTAESADAIIQLILQNLAPNFIENMSLFEEGLVKVIEEVNITGNVDTLNEYIAEQFAKINLVD